MNKHQNIRIRWDTVTPHITADSPIAIYVIVERQFFSFPDFSLRKDPHSHMLPYYPLGHVAIRIARMIQESGYASLSSCVYILKGPQCAISSTHCEPDTISTTHFTLLQHHKIEMLKSFLGILSDPLAEHGL